MRKKKENTCQTFTKTAVQKKETRRNQ